MCQVMKGADKQEFTVDIPRRPPQFKIFRMDSMNLSRRSFFALAAGGTLMAQEKTGMNVLSKRPEDLGNASFRILRLHHADRAFSSSAPTFYVPTVNLNDWRLSIDGEVAMPLTLTMDELKKLPSGPARRRSRMRRQRTRLSPILRPRSSMDQRQRRQRPMAWSASCRRSQASGHEGFRQRNSLQRSRRPHRHDAGFPPQPINSPRRRRSIRTRCSPTK